MAHRQLPVHQCERNRPNRSVDSDTLRQGAASRAGERTSRSALPQRTGHLRR